MNTLDKLLNLDRRIIYLVIGIIVIVPFFVNINFPIYVSPPVQSVYDYIDALPTGSVVLISFSFGPSTMPELHPMYKAVVRHCFSKKLKVIGITLHSEGATIADKTLKDIAQEYGYKEHEDYVYLGYKVQPVAVILGIGEDISNPFPTDYSKIKLSDIPMMKDIHNYNDINLVVDFGSMSTPEYWVIYAGAKYKEKVAAGCTGVMVSGLYPYLDTGQLIGLIGGLKGAAEYEKLINKQEKATVGMRVQSIVHLAIIIMVIFGNVVYLLSLRQRKLGKATD
jgi:hypothetical protein